jgi:sRNA-binding carbon storage regulator CsrA
MNDQEIYQKIKKITKAFDLVQDSIDFYRIQFSELEDKLEYYSKYSWLPESKDNVKNTINQMKEVILRTEIEQQHFDELEKQLDDVENNL